MLTLEIELLTGVYRASLPDGSASEWPPHPERVFSALVQAWADAGRDPAERDALEWLETQDLPVIEASGEASDRDAPTVFVPTNDHAGGDEAALPDRRGRQPRAFRAAVPADPVIRFHWGAEPSDTKAAALRRLAHRVASLGHSASLVRFAFDVNAAPARSAAWEPDPQGPAVLRAPYAGRLADLERWFSDDDGRKRVERPRTLRPERYRSPRSGAELAPAARSVFGGAGEWFVFEDAGGFRPDLLGFAQVARRMRDAVMKGGPQPPPEIVSGHRPDGAPSARPHVAFVPLANVGWSHATGDLLGFAVVLPRAAEPGERQAAIRALAAFVRVEGDRAHGRVNLTAARVWSVERSAAPSRASLAPARWCGIGRTWASGTPVFLDRFPDGGDPIEEARIIAAACRNIGLPEPLEIEIHKHSAVAGAPAAYPARGGAVHPDWSFPAGATYRDRPRRHVVLRFAEAVEGPVILGAARYHGLGLCLPLDAVRPE